MPRLSVDQWQAIRNCWECDPDSPSHEVAAARAGEKFGFKPPSKSNVHAKCTKDSWQRQGSMNGVNVAAQRKADALVDASGNRTIQNEQNQQNAKNGVKNEGVSSLALVQASREESENKRAEVTARHRTEWKQIAVLRQEALAVRTLDPGLALHKIRIAKIAAETTAIQQLGERKAWGLDIQVDIGDVRRMTDQELEAIIGGKTAL